MSQISLASSDTAASAVAVVVFQDVRTVPAGYAALDEALGGLIERTIQRPEFKASRGTVVTAYPQRGETFERVLLVGLGEAAKLDGDALRMGMSRLVGAARAAKIEAIDLRVVEGLDGRLPADQTGHAIADGLSIGTFALTQFKGAASASQGSDAAQPSDAAGLTVRVDDAVREAVDAGLRIGRGVSTARRLAATPPNVAHPAYLADQCRALADEVGLT